MKLTAQQLENLRREYYDTLPESLQGWTMDWEESTGSFDSEKGAMYDFEVYLYNPDGKLCYEGTGGWSHQGVEFYEDIEFEDVTQRVETKSYNLTDVEERCIAACVDFVKNGNVGADAIEGYSELTNEEAWAGLESLSIKFY